jgi:hypothetical protein
MTTTDDIFVLPPQAAPTGVTIHDNSTHIHTTIIGIPTPAKVASAGAAVGKRLAPKPAQAPITNQSVSPIIGAGAVSETNTRDANGHAVTKFEDGTGASVTVRGRHNGSVTVTLQDATRVTTTFSDSNGFNGSTLYTVPQLGTPQQIKQLESAKGTSGFSFFAGRIINGDVECGKESASVSDDVIDAVTRERLQAFAKEHPALAAKLKQSKEKVTVIGGVPATMEQVENTPASHKACPENMRGIGAVLAR